MLKMLILFWKGDVTLTNMNLYMAILLVLKEIWVKLFCDKLLYDEGANLSYFTNFAWQTL